MPRYFFHLRCAEKEPRTSPEETSVTLIKPGRQHAQPPVSPMAQVNGDVTWLTRLFKMTDEAGEIVFELPFASA